MGMASSQARLLTLTARQSDIELKSQQISNAKMRIASESESVSANYLEALNKTKLTATCWSNSANGMVTQDLTVALLEQMGIKLHQVQPNGEIGNRVVTYENELPPIQQVGTILLQNPSSSDIADMLASGQFTLVKDGVRVSVSELTQIVETSDDTDMAQAEAEYNAKTLKLNNKEKQLDMQLKTLDTEHSAVKTEFESVKTLVSENVEKSFQMFS